MNTKELQRTLSSGNYHNVTESLQYEDRKDRVTTFQCSNLKMAGQMLVCDNKVLAKINPKTDKIRTDREQLVLTKRFYDEQEECNVIFTIK